MATLARMSSLAPSLLLAMPDLADPNFRRAVVLLVHHDEDGTVGLVLNRKADLTATDLCESLDALRSVAGEPPAQLRLFLGYAGWGPGQLEAELAAGAWVVAPFAHEPIFAVSEDELWSHVWRLLGIDPATIVSTPGIH